MMKKAEKDSGPLWVRGPKIGMGSFGSVYKARSKNHRSLPPVLAVKSAEISVSSTLQKERKIMRLLEGRLNVIQCFGEETTVGEYGETVYNLLMEFASGGSLYDRIKRMGSCGLPEEEVKHYTRCILEGLVVVHALGYVHCDLKPENVLLASSDECSSSCYKFHAKIADFGLATKRGKKVGMRGTPMYVAPEILDSGIIDTPCDVWSLGCTVLCMLTGKQPWDMEPGDEDVKLLIRICLEPESPIIPSDIPEEARDFLGSCLNRNPEKRMTARELLDHPFVRARGEVESKILVHEEERLVNREGGPNNALSSTLVDDDFIQLGTTTVCDVSRDENEETKFKFSDIYSIRPKFAETDFVPVAVM